MKDKEKIENLRECFENTIWMAIRYADGRNTYAPGMVRDAVKKYREMFPDWKPKKDVTLEPPRDEEMGKAAFFGDYLYDIVND